MPRFKTGGMLEKAGVLTAFHTDDWITDSRVFRRSAALAVRAGMSREAALKALTLAGAEMLDLRRPHRLAGAGQGRRLRHPRRRSAERLLQDAGNLGRRREGLRSQPTRPTSCTPSAATAPGTTRPRTSAASTTSNLGVAK